MIETLDYEVTSMADSASPSHGVPVAEVRAEAGAQCFVNTGKAQSRQRLKQHGTIPRNRISSHQAVATQSDKNHDRSAIGRVSPLTAVMDKLAPDLRVGESYARVTILGDRIHLFDKLCCNVGRSMPSESTGPSYRGVVIEDPLVRILNRVRPEGLHLTT